MIEKTEELVLSTIFSGSEGKIKTSGLSEEFLANAQVSQQEISIMGKNISKLYSELKKIGDEEAIAGFREYIKNMALNYDAKTSGFSNLLWKEMIEKGEKENITSLFENYLSLVEENNKEFANMLVNESISIYETFGYDTASNYISSLNKIADLSEKNEMANSLKDFFLTWKKISGSSDLAFEDKQKILDEFASRLKNSTSLEDIKNTIKKYDQIGAN
jgi:hypothetical protein